MAPRRIARAVMVTDLLVLAIATFGAMVFKFGLSTPERTWGSIEMTYPEFGVALAVFWSCMLSVFESRDVGVLGRGWEEFRRIGRATAFTFGSVAVAAVVLKMDFSRMYVAVALPLGMVGLVISRYAWRLAFRNNVPGWTVGALVVGSSDSATRLGELLATDPHRRFDVVGHWDPTKHDSGTEDVVELRKHFDEVEASALIITDPHALGPHSMRILRWELEGAEFFVVPHFNDVAPGRTRLEYVSGETLIHLAQPQFERAGGILKTLFDRTIAAFLVILLSPVLMAIAIAVKASSPGKVLFGQERVGKDGHHFTIWKFRSMRAGADAELQELLRQQNGDESPLFKPVDDPRVTTIGRFIRRYSLDELPQLFNVLNGSMSLVGPRPQVPDEVALYEGIEGARLRVRPGITGLWQVSGRSNLTWPEAVRLDVYYVENWSMLVDLLILWKTVGVVLRTEGAR